MGYSSLARFKSHLRLEQDQDDLYDGELQGYLDAAEDYVAQFLNRTVPWYDDTTSPATEIPVPASVQIATYMLAADYHENREAQIIGVSVTENQAVMNMLWPYRVGLGV